MDIDRYRLTTSPPSLDDYVLLREQSGLTPKRVDQAGPAQENSWAWRTAQSRTARRVRDAHG